MEEIVILGAGYAGLRALKGLQKQTGDFHITLINKNSYHYEATDLHEVAAGTQPWNKISYEIKDVVDSNKTTFIQDEVIGVDRETRQVQLKSQGVIRYDQLVIALGFESETFGIPGAKENALEMVDIDSSLKINLHIREMMNRYLETKDSKYLKIVVCGAGFTGIELVGSLVEAKKEFAQIAKVDPAKVEIYCVEAAPSILPMFNDRLTEYCLKHLDRWDVRLMTGKPIKAIEPNRVVYAEDEVLKGLEAATIIWTTGVSGSSLIGQAGFDQRRGRVVVTPHLEAPNDENIYIIGDVAAVMNPETNAPYPTTAQIALKMGDYVAKDFGRRLTGQARQPFTFQSQGSVASIGNTHAFGQVGTMSISGYPASFVKKMIMNKSLLETGGMKTVMAKGRFDLYH